MLRELSVMDTKSLSGKSLKVTEENGELAGELQAYDGLDGAHHRITTEERVLEEAIDVILASVSIPLSMGFSENDITDMMQRKMNKWAELQKKQAVSQGKLPYEIHITVKEAQIKHFQQVCHNLGVKPIMLDLQQPGSDNVPHQVIKDVMTSSTLMGNNTQAWAEMERIAKGLECENLSVVRKKIETVPWHPAAPSDQDALPEMPKDCYFESHIAVIVDDPATRSKIDLYCLENNLHASRNAFKHYGDGSYKLMLTHRAYEGTQEQFKAVLAGYVRHLLCIKNSHGELLTIDKVITEFSLFDSKISHDQAWLLGG
jgi:hypothetical protein